VVTFPTIVVTVSRVDDIVGAQQQHDNATEISGVEANDRGQSCRGSTGTHAFHPRPRTLSRTYKTMLASYLLCYMYLYNGKPQARTSYL